jgi:hypothetical protein
MMKVFFSTSLLVLFAVANAADKDNFKDRFKDRLVDVRSGNHGASEVRMMYGALSYTA